MREERKEKLALGLGKHGTSVCTEKVQVWPVHILVWQADNLGTLVTVR